MATKSTAWARREAQRCRRQYVRHFAGQPRNTRDPSLLAAFVEGQEQALAVFAADASSSSLLDTARADLELYKGELGRVQAALREGDMSVRAQRAALRANGLFAQYRAHFANKPRSSRSLGLLVRLTGALADIHQEMVALAALGVNTERHQANTKLVADRLEAWTREQSQIDKAQRALSLDNRIGGLGAAANAVFEVWRKEAQPLAAAARDRALLSQWCDELCEVARQMDALEVETKDPRNSTNLGIVTTRLQELERAYDEASAPASA